MHFLVGEKRHPENEVKTKSDVKQREAFKKLFHLNS